MNLPFKKASPSTILALDGTGSPSATVEAPSEKKVGSAKPSTCVPTPKSVSKIAPSASNTMTFWPVGEVAPPNGPRNGPKLLALISTVGAPARPKAMGAVGISSQRAQRGFDDATASV